jgi:hypothetical protein
MSEITREEWDEMNSIRKAMMDHPASVHPDKMERFTELFVKTLPKGENKQQ